MIKKSEIIAQYHVNMYCDVCGLEMKYQGYHKGQDPQEILGVLFENSEPIYEYKCLFCGTTQTSKKLYPYQQYEYDKNSAVEIEEEE